MDGAWDESDWRWGDYDLPFSDISEDEFLYRAMDESDPMYIGDNTFIEEDYVETETDDDYEDRVADWYFTANDGEGWDWLFEFDKESQTLYVPVADPDDDPKHYFDDINYNPFPEK